MSLSSCLLAGAGHCVPHVLIELHLLVRLLTAATAPPLGPDAALGGATGSGAALGGKSGSRGAHEFNAPGLQEPLFRDGARCNSLAVSGVTLKHSNSGTLVRFNGIYDVPFFK